MLPAVWSTRPLSGAVRDIALSGGTSALLAIAYETGGIEFYDLEGDPVGQQAGFRVRALADGRTATMGDTPLTLFPGVTETGELKAYVFAPGLVAPAQIDLPVTESRRVEGLCTGESGPQALMRLAYWTVSGNRILRTGLIGMQGDTLTWTEEAMTETDFPIRSCVFSEGELVASPSAIAAAALTRGDVSALLSLEAGGPLKLSTDYGMTSQEISVRDGITITAPDRPTALTAHGSLQSGGFQGGVVVIAGETASGTHQAVFVDPSQITLERR
ncbi:hypothetical protein [Hyphomonas sp.]|uniref:hypothetical protein n=1 Tax=Hyphomonas sp. TaxID=87 RepID=UPI00391A408A